MSNRIVLTKAKIDAIKSTSKRQYFFDEKQKGLRLAVTPAGNKSFQFQCWSPAKQRPVTETLGKVGSVSLSEARKKAAELLSQVSLGADPEQIKQERRAELTLDDIFAEYIKYHAQGKKRSWEADVANYARQIKETLGKKKPSEITQATVKRWHSKVGEQKGPVIANRVKALLSVIFSTCLSHLDNPCKGVKKFPEASRERFLKPEELKAFFSSLVQEKQNYIDFFSLLLLTGARKSNCLAMKWSDISNGVWTIPAAESKNGKSINIPLAGRAAEILKSRQKNDSLYVFPGTGATGHLRDPKKAWQRVIKRAGLEDLHIHDLRRTLGSYQAMSGANMAVIGASLGHRNLRSTEVYARLQTDPVRQSIEVAADTIFNGGKDDG